ncbi:MAG: hypothetical protein ABW118_16495 [Candidatus Thiodiazotropha sp.]
MEGEIGEGSTSGLFRVSSAMAGVLIIIAINTLTIAFFMLTSGNYRYFRANKP